MVVRVSRPRLISSLSAISILLLACRFDDRPDQIHQRKFLKMTSSQQEEEIRKSPPEKQIELYIEAVSKIHPAPRGLAPVIARRGAVLVPIVLQKLQEEEREYVKIDLLEILMHMHWSSYYDFSADKETMNTIKEDVASMKDTSWKLMAEQIIREIAPQQ